MTRKLGRPISTLAYRCAGCLTCELRCALKSEKKFLLAASAIEVRRTGSGAYRISFSERCDNCGICVRYCMYGALVQQPGGGRP